MPSAERPHKHGVTGLLGLETVKRGLRCVTEGRALSLSRPVVASASAGGAHGSVEFAHVGFDTETRTFDEITVGYDWLGVASHGIENTHLDGLNHIGWQGQWFSGVPTTEVARPDIADWADGGLLTRAHWLDIPALRGEVFVRPGSPVTGRELEQASGAVGLEVEPGDGILLYMGRDHVEASGRALHPAVDRSAADWIRDRQVSVVCWDLLDAPVEDRAQMSVHRLIPEVGLALVDNCDLSPCVPIFRDRDRDAPASGLLCVAPLKLEGATGCLVNPLLLV